MKRKTIRNHRDFLTTPKDLMVRTDYFMVKAKNAKIPNDARYGIIVSKKSLRFATQRNRAKRMLRDWICFCEDLMLPEFDYIFIGRFNILNVERDIGRNQMKSALKKISDLYKNQKNDK